MLSLPRVMPQRLYKKPALTCETRFYVGCIMARLSLCFQHVPEEPAGALLSFCRMINSRHAQWRFGLAMTASLARFFLKTAGLAVAEPGRCQHPHRRPRNRY
jgi:hypothetical protein